MIEGWRSEQIAEAINRNATFGFSGADFMALVGPNAAVPSWFSAVVAMPAGASLEGFLFPDTYQLSLGASAADLRDAMLKNFLQRVTPQMRTDASTQGLTLYQAISLASIIEREAKIETERPTIDQLTPTELRVLRLIAENQTSKEIGKQLFISARTVDTHRNNISNNLHLHGQRGLLVFALENKDELQRLKLFPSDFK